VSEMIDVRQMLRIVRIAAIAGFIVCAVILLDATAPNPTHRRHSSQMPVTTEGGTTREIGLSGEEVLALDLGLPRNELSEQRQCICGAGSNPPPSECNSCLLHLDSVTAFRRPDFVANGFIAEAKNRRALLANQTNLAQIRDYATAARELKVPLWLFVRADSLVDSEYQEIVRSTGGGIVFYFATPGFADPVSSAAAIGVIGFTILGVGSVSMRYIRLPSLSRRSLRRRPSPAESSVENARDYVDRVKASSDQYSDRGEDYQ
jgi:hypothetical protein